MNKGTKTGLAVAFIVIALGLAGRMDYEETVISHMSEAAYNAVVSKVGDSASYKTIIKEYKSHREYYDSLN